MTLAEFIETEIKRRGLSIREFSRLADLSHTTISQYLSQPEKRNVSIDFLVKLSKATNTDLTSIVAMVYPEHTTINPEIRILAEQIANLPPEKRQMVDSLLLGMSIRPDSGDDK